MKEILIENTTAITAKFKASPKEKHPKKWFHMERLDVQIEDGRLTISQYRESYGGSLSFIKIKSFVILWSLFIFFKPRNELCDSTRIHTTFQLLLRF